MDALRGDATKVARSSRRVATAVACTIACAAGPAAHARVVIVQPLPDQVSINASQDPLSNGIVQRSQFGGNLFGLRTMLGRYGVSLNLSETSEVLGNVSGGIARNAAYDGLTVASLDVDSRRAGGYAGGTLHVSALDYHGRNFSADTLLNLQTVSGIEADRALRLWEVWYDQSLWNNTADIKIGQQSLDTEFMVSTSALLFVNTMSGWPLVPSADLPGGGPAYPLSALGIRLSAQVTPNVRVLTGVFNGSPASAHCIDPDAQRCNPSGTSFPLDGGELMIGELQYAYPANGDLVTAGLAQTAPGAIRLGFWVDTERFSDLRVDGAGVALSSPGSSGFARSHSGDWSVYGVIDQTIWSAPDGGARALTAFTRAMGAPGDRNLVSLSVNAGLVLHQPIGHRDDDSAGIAVSYGRIGADTIGADRDARRASGAGLVRSAETVLEATYQYVPFDWLLIQPDVQFVFNPGAGLANPSAPDRRLGNEAVFGVRTTIVF